MTKSREVRKTHAVPASSQLHLVACITQQRPGPDIRCLLPAQDMAPGLQQAGVQLAAPGRTLADSQRAAQPNSLALPMTASVVSASTSVSATPS